MEKNTLGQNKERKQEESSSWTSVLIKRDTLHKLKIYKAIGNYITYDEALNVLLDTNELNANTQ